MKKVAAVFFACLLASCSMISGMPSQAKNILKETGVKGGAILPVASKAQGSKKAEYRLESLPVFDGMAASGGGLYLAMADGSVLCMEGKR